MKAVIDGIIYDEDKATEVAHHESNHNRGDFNWYHEDLYVTAKGRWFLAGEGGPMSHYKELVCGGYGHGEKITPLTPEQAQRWLEEHDKVEVLEKYFGYQLEEA